MPEEKKINIEKLSKKVCERFTHLRTYFYHAYPFRGKPPTPEQEERYRRTQKFFYSINRIPNHEFVEIGRVQPHYLSCPACGKDIVRPRQKGVDVGIALELVRMADQHVADVFILISGDEDLAKAVELAKGKLANVIVYYVYDPPAKMFGSRKLNNTADERFHMDLNFLEECAL